MEKKGKKIKLEWNSEMIGVLIDKLNIDGVTYIMTLTNYTCLIQSPVYSYHFIKHMQRQSVFSTTNDLKRYMDSSLKNISTIDRESVRYYNAKIIGKPLYLETVYNIDINAAYPTCLLNSKLIDHGLYSKLMTLNKEERLAAIGMMASRKRIFTINSGEVQQYEETESPYSKYFFFCVKSIADLIFECELITGLSFIFSWVDGLYVDDRFQAEKCRRLLAKAGYRSTVSLVRDFQYVPMNNRIQIKFAKDGENKLFNIPIENNRVAQIIKFIHDDTKTKGLYGQNTQRKGVSDGITEILPT